MPLEVNSANVVSLTFPAKAEYITLGRLALTGLSRARELAPETLADLKLAFTEACSNSIRHAYPEGTGKVEILYQLQDDRLVVEVLDRGRGLSNGSAKGDDAAREGGLGLAIIRAVADEVDLGEREGGGLRLRFVKLLDS
jgi:serine/threonine-protein kinase RsbW